MSVRYWLDQAWGRWRQPQPGADFASAVVVVQPTRNWFNLDVNRLWGYRDLAWILAMRDIQVRYKQTCLGVMWAVIQPLVLMIVFRLFLGRFTGMTDPIALYAGLLPWTLFAAAVNAANGSLVNNASMLGKVYFPRLLLPLASLGAPLVDYLIAFVVLLGMMVWFGAAFGVALIWIPLLLISVLITAMGVGVLLAALTVSYRDFRYVVPFLIQVWFFVSPVIYDVPDWTLRFNPMGGVIAAFRNVVLNQPIDYSALLSSTAIGAAILIVGLTVFARMERRFADVV